MCVPDVVKGINIKAFNLMSRAWHETCKCKCRLDPSVFNNKQRRNKNKCRFECKELIGKGICDNRFIWNPSNYKCECDKSCGIGQHLYYENYKCRKKLLDKLAKECSENIDESGMISVNLNDYESACHSYTINIVLFVISSLIIIDISGVFIYFHWYLKKSNTGVIDINPGTETVIN